MYDSEFEYNCKLCMYSDILEQKLHIQNIVDLMNKDSSQETFPRGPGR